MLACITTGKTCEEQGTEFEIQRAVNIPDWEACSVVCLGKPECTDGWHYNVEGKLCILYRRCTPRNSNDNNNIVGNRTCHATRK